MFLVKKKTIDDIKTGTVMNVSKRVRDLYVVVNFDADGGEASYTTKNYMAGKEYGELPNATKEGLAFLCWSKDGEKISEDTIVEDVDTLVAMYRSKGNLEIDCNLQWGLPAHDWTPTSAQLEDYTIIESYSNWHVSNGQASAQLNFSGTDAIDFYICSYAESTYDYCRVDRDGTSIASTRGNQYDPRTSPIESWIHIFIEGLDPSQTYAISVVYLKDGSVDSGFDRGWVAIPNNMYDTTLSQLATN